MVASAADLAEAASGVDLSAVVSVVPAFAQASSGAPAFGPRFGFRNRLFFRNRFAFAAVPFGVGEGFYGGCVGDGCQTAWGWQCAWVCDYY